MLERDVYPPGVPCWVDTMQPDPDAAVAFYGGLFGWEFRDLMAPGSPGGYLVAELEGREVAALGWSSEGPRRSPAWSTYVAVENADRTAAVAEEAGGRVLAGPVDVLDAGRTAVVADPAGAVFCLWEARSLAGARVVNVPNSWNWSNLETHDPDAAVAFYRTVFGWEAKPITMGGDTAMLWQLPFYGDYLATIDPTLRERHAAPGVPEGFSDAVGWMVLAPGSTGPGRRAAGAAPSRWTVTFAVDDADAVAGRAERLGGRVVSGPTASGPSRTAVVADPAGAEFTVSAYAPGPS